MIDDDTWAYMGLAEGVSWVPNFAIILTRWLLQHFDFLLLRGNLGHQNDWKDSQLPQADVDEDDCEGLHSFQFRGLQRKKKKT